jgi:DNA-binding transcriptional ArsR family regulator
MRCAVWAAVICDNPLSLLVSVVDPCSTNPPQELQFNNQELLFLGGFLAPRRPPSLTNPRLVTALAHPTRLKAMRVFWERAATPREVAEEIGEPPNNVAYHVRVLRRLNCIELVETRPARGGRVSERLYRAGERYQVWDEDNWKRLSEAERLAFTRAVTQQIAEDVAEAMATGTYFDDDDSHLSRMPMNLDQTGWSEVAALLTGTLEELIAIQDRVEARTEGESERPHHARVNILHFRSPPPRRSGTQ